jgi:hypothetical protein
MQDPMQTALGGGGGADPAQAQADAAAGLERLLGRIRAIDDEIQALAADMPDLASAIEPVRRGLKQMVVAVAKAAPQQTPSGAALPV